jgi:multisubunit Na+/H+ antiporter MnhC subunit
LRVVCGLVTATLALLVYGVGLGVSEARAGTPGVAQAAAQAAATPVPTAVAVPTAIAIGAATAAKTPQMVMNDQEAAAETSVTQQQPTNVVISIRIDSPGDNGPVSQTNIAVGSANGTNDASTGQAGASGDAGQDASTNQQAGANTTVTQDQAGNLVVTVRINSPGNNGPVSQTNAAVGNSNAKNTSETSQGAQGPAPVSRKAPRKKAAGGTSSHASHAPAPRQNLAAATAPATASPVAPAPARHGADAKAPGAVRAHPRHATSAGAAHSGRAAASAGSSADRLSASPLGNAIDQAGNLLGTVAPTAPIGTARRSADVSSSVLYSLLAALGIGAAFVGWSLRPAWHRQRRFGSGLLR